MAGKKKVELEEVSVSFQVLDSTGAFVREYTLELHGENAEALANQFAGKIGGEVKVVELSEEE